MPIRATVGEPKFWRYGTLVFIRALAPSASSGKGSTTTKLAAATATGSTPAATSVVARLAAIARSQPGRQLVVLCFENVYAGQVCHRRWFAEWLEDRYGIAVPEVEDRRLWLLRSSIRLSLPRMCALTETAAVIGLAIRYAHDGHVSGVECGQGRCAGEPSLEA